LPLETVNGQKDETSHHRAWLVIWSVPALLFAAAAYELAQAVEILGRNAVEREETVAAVASITMLFGAIIAALFATRPSCPWAVALFAPAGAAFVVTRFYAFDPYYLPTLRRYVEGAVPPAWIFGIVAGSVAVGAVSRLLPRVGSIASAIVLFCLPFISAIASSGH
jgi:hypothetical protein